MPFLCLPAELVFLPELCKDLLHVFQSTPSIYSAGSWQQLSESTLRHHPMVRCKTCKYTCITNIGPVYTLSVDTLEILLVLPADTVQSQGALSL